MSLIAITHCERGTIKNARLVDCDDTWSLTTVKQNSTVEPALERVPARTKTERVSLHVPASRIAQICIRLSVAIDRIPHWLSWYPRIRSLI